MNGDPVVLGLCNGFMAVLWTVSTFTILFDPIAIVGSLHTMTGITEIQKVRCSEGNGKHLQGHKREITSSKIVFAG